jgi:PKD repeat protein
MRRFYTLILLCGALFSQAQCPQFLNIDTAVCSGAVNITANASVLKTQLCGDSIIILFNATGTTLAGDTNVYFHSGPEFVPFEGWRLAYTVGHWGLNDGVGRMTSVGTNLWAIRINPRTYYGYPVDSCLNGIFMDFRNANGTVKAVNPDGSDVYLYTAPGTPTSTYTPISGTTETHNNAVTYLWSDGDTSSSRTFTAAANLTVTATGIGGCTAIGKVKIKTGHTPVNLGSDVVRCVANTPVTLNAGSGFVSYTWLNGTATTNSTYSAVNPGCYWVHTLDSAGCTSYYEVGVHNSDVTNLSLPDTLNTCPGGHLSANAAVNINLKGDSVIIIYNATLGQTGLVGATKVYFHSGPQFYANGGWQGNYTVGTWGLDNGVGMMTSLGNNLWRIAIDPYCYYRVNPDTPLIGIYADFRNADGSQSGKDNNGNDIHIVLTSYPPTSTFAGVTITRTATQPLTYNWSNGITTATNSFTSAGVYRVTVADNYGCSATDSVVATFTGNLSIHLGTDTTICHGASVTLTAPANLAHYLWSNAATTQTISVSATGVYSLTATDTSGCQSTASRRVTVSTSQVNIGSNIVQCSKTPITITANTGFVTYQWQSGTVGTTNTHSAVNPGLYWVKAIDSAGCSSTDTISVHFSDVLGLTLTDTISSCPGSFVSLNANTSVEQNGDSLVIIYDATTGQTGLIGAAKVYFHSGPQFYAGGIWQPAYTVGNWGQDDGIGKMDSLGNNHWRIAIDPHTYYHMNPDTPLTGIYMVFRNANGTQTGKDGNGNNIYVGLPGGGAAPVSTFFGVYAFRASSGNITYLWSNSTPAASTAVSTPGVYTVTATDTHGCISVDSSLVLFNGSLSLNLGPADTSICGGQSLTLSPGAGFAHYTWSNGATTASVVVDSAGTYSVSVTNGNCSAADTILVSVHSHPISIGSNVVRCNTSPVTLTASNGFNSYHWFGATASSQTYSAVHPGSYWVKGVDAAGCSAYDTITVTNSSVLGLLLTDSFVSCGRDTVRLDAATSINANGDSLTIIYDATKGQTGLVGATKVYMHSSPQYYAGQTWGSITVGNWGQDDGIGKMTSLGNNKWTITINPRNYYVINPDTPLLGIFIVFRNANGSATGKDNSGNNILLNLTGIAPASTFTGITGHYSAAQPLTYSWSNGAVTSATYFTSGGTFMVTVSDNNGCSAVDSTMILAGQSLNVNLGPDTTVCTDSIIIISAGSGFTSYVWNTGASTSSIFVAAAGTYYVTVSNSQGCTGRDSVVVSSGQSPVINLGHDTTDCSPVVLNAGSGYAGYHWTNGSSSSSITVSTPGHYAVTVTSSGGCKGVGSVVVDSCATVIITGCGSPVANFGLQSLTPGNTVTLRDSSHGSKIQSYEWEFGDGTTGTDIGSTVHTYGNPGYYTVTLIVRDSCGGVDSISKRINVNATGIAYITGLNSLNLYPNPNNGNFNVDAEIQTEQEFMFALINQLGQTVWTEKAQLFSGHNLFSINTPGLASGFYTLELSNGKERAFRKLTITR